MTAEQRQDRNIKPIKPLLSGRNRDARPSAFSNPADFLDSDEDSEEGENERMDKLLQGSGQTQRESGRAVQEIRRASEIQNNEESKTVQNPLRTQNTLQAPPSRSTISGGLPMPPKTPARTGVLPAPPKTTATAGSSLPTPPKTPVTTGSTLPQPPQKSSTLIKPPSTSTSSTLVPPQKSQGLIPPTSSSGTSGLPKPPGPLDRKNLPQPPVTTRSTAPPNLLGKQQTLKVGIDSTSDNKASLAFDDEESNLSQAELRQLRQQKVREAQRLKEDVQAELERTENQKLAGMTPEEQLKALAEKKRIEGEKQAMSAQKRLQLQQKFEKDQEIQQLNKQIAQLQADVDKTVQNKEKLNETNQKIATTQVEIQKFESKIEVEVQQSLQEQKQAVQDLEVVQQETQQKYHQKAQLEGQTAGVQKDFLSYEVSKSKLANNIVEHNLNIEKLTLLSSKLSENLNDLKTDANKVRDDLIEEHYEIVEIQYRHKEKLLDRITQGKWQRTQNRDKLEQLENEQSQHKENFKILSDYQVDCSKTSDQVQQELDLLTSIMKTKQKLYLLESIFQQNEVDLSQQEDLTVKESSSISVESEQITQEISKIVLSYKEQGVSSLDLQKKLNEINFKLSVVQQQNNDLDDEANQTQQKIDQLKGIQTSEITSFQESGQAYQIQSDERFRILKDISDNTETQLNKAVIDLQAANQANNQLKQTQNLFQQQNHDNQQKKQSCILQKQQLSSQINDKNVQLSGMHTYVTEIENQTDSSRGGLSLLKDNRLSHLAMAYKTHLDEVKREAEADQKLLELRQEILNLNSEIEVYKQRQNALKSITLSYNDIETAHHQNVKQHEGENSEFTIEFQNAQSEIENLEIALQEQESAKDSLLQSQQELVKNHSQVSDERESTNSQLESLILESNSVQEQLSKGIQQKEVISGECQQLEVDRASVLANMIELNPTFEQESQELKVKIKTEQVKLEEAQQQMSQIENTLVQLSNQTEQNKQYIVDQNMKENELKKVEVLLHQSNLELKQTKDESLGKINSLKTNIESQSNILANLVKFSIECDEKISCQKDEYKIHLMIRKAYINFQKLASLHQEHTNELSIQENEAEQDHKKVAEMFNQIQHDHEAHETIFSSVSSDVNGLANLIQTIDLEIEANKLNLEQIEKQESEIHQQIKNTEETRESEKTGLLDQHGQLESSLEIRLGQINDLIQNVSQQNQNSKHQLDISHETNAVLSSQNVALQEKKTSFIDQQSNHQQSKTKLQEQLSQNNLQFSKIQTYDTETNQLTQSGQDGLSILKDNRLSQIAVAYKLHLDQVKREMEADAMISQLRQDIESINSDIQLYKERKIVLESITQSNIELKTVHQQSEAQNEIENGELNSQNHQIRVEIEQQQSKLQELENSLQQYQLSSNDIQQNHKNIDEEVIITKSLLEQSNQESNNAQELFKNHKEQLQEDSNQNQTMQQERDLILASMVETNPEFVTLSKEISDQISNRMEDLKQLSQQLQQIESSIIDEQKSIQTQNDEIEKQKEQSKTLQTLKETLNIKCTQNVDLLQKNKQLKQDMQDRLINNQKVLENLVLYLQELANEQDLSNKSLKDLQEQRLIFINQTVKSHLEAKEIEQMLDLEISQLRSQLTILQNEVTEYSKSKAIFEEKNIELQNLSSSLNQEEEVNNKETSQINQNLSQIRNEIETLSINIEQETSQTQKVQNDQAQIFSERLQEDKQIDQTTNQLKQQEEELSQIVQSLQMNENIKKDLSQEILSLDSQMQNSLAEKLSQLQSDLTSTQKQTDNMIEEIQRVKGRITENETKKEQNLFRKSETEKAKSQLQIKNLEHGQMLSTRNEYFQNSKNFLQEVIQCTEQQQEIMKNERLNQINEEIEKQLQEQLDQQKQAAAAPIAEGSNKRRHARNQSMIGQLAASTFEVAEQSKLSANQVEEQVLNALEIDSLGQKIIIVEQKEELEESKEIIQNEKDQENIKNNPILSNIEEADEESLAQEYGSEIGPTAGRPQNNASSTSAVKNPQNNFGVVGPQLNQEQSTHGRQSSAGSVQVPVQEEAPVEIITQVKQLPTVPVPTIITNQEQQTPSQEVRVSIFDMRKQSKQGSYRATTYDKITPTRRLSLALKQKLNLGSAQSHNNQEENVLGDLLICFLAQKSILMIHSDFEICQGYVLFEQLYSADPKCDEALFGLGRINYIQGRYELAEKLFIKSYEAKRDFVYRVWLGFTQLQIFLILSDENPKKIKAALNSFQNLERCTKESKVKLFANFGLLYLSQKIIEMKQSLKGLQDPSYYADAIKNYAKYEGTLALAIVQLGNQNKQGLNTINEAIKSDISRPHAYYILINYYLTQKNFTQALVQAEEAYEKVTDYENFQERLTLILLLCKCLVKDGQTNRALIMLQMQYTESPHFSSLLYAYGKYIVQTNSMHQAHLASAISALEEVKRISCQIRSTKACYWLAEASKISNQLTLAGLYQIEYLNGIKQVTKSGPIKYKTFQNQIECTPQLQILNSIENFKFKKLQTLRNKDILLVNPTQLIEDQIEVKLPQKSEILNLCAKIQDPQDQQLFRAIVLYKLQQNYQLADKIFTELMSQSSVSIAIRIENIKFLRNAIKFDQKLERISKAESEARLVITLLRQQTVSANIWADGLTECAKLLFACAKSSDSQIEALECLLQLKQCLPVIDNKLAAVEIGGKADRYLSEELENLDFQGQTFEQISQENPQLSGQQVEDVDQFRPQADFDESNRFFMQTRYAQARLQTCPLATLSIAEIHDQTRTKGDQVFYFGSIQNDLAHEIEETQTQSEVKTHSEKFYRSSTPLIAVLKYLQHLKRVNQTTSSLSQLVNTQSVEKSLINDIGFCVRSKPDFLYVIAKMCYKSGNFVDLAVQSLHQYQQLLSFYRNFIENWQVKTIKAKLLLAQVLKRMSTDPSQDKQLIEQITKQASNSLKQILGQSKEIQSPSEMYLAERAARLLKELQQ